MLLILLFNLLLAGATIYAFIRGGAPERVVAAAFIAAAAATYLPPPDFTTFERAEFGLFVIDSALLAVLIAVALRANRFWPIWVAACQLFTVLVHITMAYQRDILPIVYFVVVIRISYPMLILLVIGTERHFRRKKRFGSDPDWSRQRPREKGASIPGPISRIFE